MPSGKRVIGALRLAANDGVAHVELAVFEQGDEATAEAEKSAARTTKACRECSRSPLELSSEEISSNWCSSLGLPLGGGAQLGVSHGDRAEAGNRGHQRFFLGGENTVGARIDEDRSLRTRGTEMERRSTCRERPALPSECTIAADGDGDGLSRGNGALRQIGGEANGLAIMAGAGRGGQLRGFGGDGRSSKGPSRRRRTETRRVRSRRRRRSASASVTASTSGVPCSAVATSARIRRDDAPRGRLHPAGSPPAGCPVVPQGWWPWRRGLH
jgi:hypothetical protein